MAKAGARAKLLPFAEVVRPPLGVASPAPAPSSRPADERWACRVCGEAVMVASNRAIHEAAHGHR